MSELILLEDFEVQEEERAESIRPASLDDFIGQEEAKDALREPIEVAKLTHKPLRHLLLTGPPGTGKTTLAEMMANELGSGYVETTGEALTDSGSLLKILLYLEPRDLLFIDEIHLLPPKLMQAMYRVMEDGKFPVVLGRGPSAATRVVQVPPFTLVGATTDTGSLKKPLLDRFRLRVHMRLYNEAELLEIAVRSADIAGYTIDYEAAKMLAQRSRFTPRILNNHLEGLCDHVLYYSRGKRHISTASAKSYFDGQDIDELGLTRSEQALLKVLCERFNGGRVGVDNLATALGEEPASVKELEKFLITQQLMIKGENGRWATNKAFAHTGIKRRGTPKGMMLQEDLDRIAEGKRSL